MAHTIATYRTMHVNYIIHTMMYICIQFSCIDVHNIRSVRYQTEQWQGLQGSVMDNMHLNYVTVIHWHLKTHSPQFL